MLGYRLYAFGEGWKLGILLLFRGTSFVINGLDFFLVFKHIFGEVEGLFYKFQLLIFACAYFCNHCL